MSEGMRKFKKYATLLILVVLLSWNVGAKANQYSYDYGDNGEEEDMKLKNIIYNRISSSLSLRWKILSMSIGGIIENGLLWLMFGSPISSVRHGMKGLKECVAEVYEEHVINCVDSPDKVVAAHFLILTDYRTWIWPPDMEEVDDNSMLLDVISRRLKPTVRDDQCDEKSKPEL